MVKASCNTQKMNVVTSSLMGIIFGSAIVYIMSRIVSAQRRITFLEQHIIRKADDDVVSKLSDRIETMNTSTQQVLTELASGVETAIQHTYVQPSAAPVVIEQPARSTFEKVIVETQPVCVEPVCEAGPICVQEVVVKTEPVCIDDNTELVHNTDKSEEMNEVVEVEKPEDSNEVVEVEKSEEVVEEAEVIVTKPKRGRRRKQ